MRSPEARSQLRKVSAGRQSGAALLILLALIAIATGAFLVDTFSASDQQEDRVRRTEAALAQAKEALIFYAASYADTHPYVSPADLGEVPGYLPCPDLSAVGTEGSAETGHAACTSKDVTAQGRLPWQTLGLPAPRDGSGECLWYAVSGNFKANLNKTDLMNWDTNGLITVLGRDGNAVATGNMPDGAVAVIFAPGPAIAGQTRAGATAPSCTGNYTASNYLDAVDPDGTGPMPATDNASPAGAANSVNAFIAGASTTGAFNDRLIFITAREIFDAIERRQHVNPVDTSGPRLGFSDLLRTVTQRTAECIARYPTRNAGFVSNIDRRLPWTTVQPFASNIYGPNSNYDDQTGRFFGRTPRIADQSRTATANTMVGTGLPPLWVWLAEANCPGWDLVDPWWQNWKDHVFYVVSADFAPNGDSTNTNCGDCVRVIAPGPEYAAIVFFAGKRLATQDRRNNFNSSASTAKGQISNYLESENQTASTDGRGTYATGAETSTFNDVLYCINEDLSVIPCP